MSGRDDPATGRHLAILLPDLSGGGAERMAIVLANAAASRGIRTSLLLLRAAGPLRATIDPGVEVVELDAATARASVLPLRRWIRDERPNALMVTPSHLGWAACLAAAGLDLKGRVFIREASTLSIDLAKMHPLARLSRLLLERFVAAGASRIALCDYCADDLARTLGLRRHRIHVIPNPVIGERPPSLLSSSLRPHAKERPVLLAAGRLVHQKGFDVLIRAFAILRRELDARLLIAGDGPDLDALQRLAWAEGCADDIVFAGYIADLGEPMQLASAFVLPSRWEGLPGVLIESLAVGTPVVATDCPGGSREILESGRWGELVPVDDPNALAGAMARVLESPHPRPHHGWMQRYAVDTAVTGYLSVMGLTGG